MRSPLEEGGWLVLDSVGSTQDAAGAVLDDPEGAGVVLALHQTAGRGRLGRRWESAPGESLTMSLVFRQYSEHSQPWLIGMAVALAVASALDARVQWPNDVVLDGKKLGGVLTELLRSQVYGRVPVIGVGLNLNQAAFPVEISGRATSLFLVRGERLDVREVAECVLAQLTGVPEPDSWGSLAEMWSIYDDTPGKKFRLPSGEHAIAVRVGEHGELVCTVAGKCRTVLAAEATGF